MPQTPSPERIDVLRRRWFLDQRGAAECTAGDRAALQAWHEQQGHQAQRPINGSCFCCCETCPPDDLEDDDDDEALG